MNRVSYVCDPFLNFWPNRNPPMAVKQVDNIYNVQSDVKQKHFTRSNISCRLIGRGDLLTKGGIAC